MCQDKFQQQLHHETLGKSSHLINAMEMEPTLQVRCHTGDQAPRLGQDSWDTAGAPYVLMQVTEKRALARPVVFLSFRTQAKDS